MLDKFKIELLRLIGREDAHIASSTNPSILLAVSGGIDSMCMLHLFYECGYRNFGVATVNFSLRGEDSDMDQQLVEKWCFEYNIPFYSKRFDTKKYSSSCGISTQMAARELRYGWFNQLAEKYGYSYISIAHNLNDSIETFFINAIRGTGLKGLGGIRKQSGNIIRPLLIFTREQIVEYVKNFGVAFRDDLTNFECHYSRNRIRNRVFPEFEQINPSFLRTMEREIEIIQSAQLIIEDLYEKKREEILESNPFRISIEKLKADVGSKYWLYMILDEFGFNSSQCDNIWNSIDARPGLEFHSESSILIRDRDFFLIINRGVGLDLPTFCKIEQADFSKNNSSSIEYKLDIFTIKLTSKEKPSDLVFKKRIHKDVSESSPDLFDSNLYTIKESRIYVDISLVRWPLIIRRWREGDRFTPLGMKGRKKVSDFLVDAKMSKLAKEHQLVIESAGEIIALVGQRLDSKFKVTSSTKNILIIDVSI